MTMSHRRTKPIACEESVGQNPSPPEEVWEREKERVTQAHDEYRMTLAEAKRRLDLVFRLVSEEWFVK